MFKKQKMKNKKGLTLVEMLMVSFLSIFILMMIYQVTSGAVNLFLSTKSNSDSLETKAPAMEIMGRYFERRGVGVVTPSADSLGLRSNPKYIASETNSFIGASAGDKITFYANLGGFAILRNNVGTYSFTSCRLNETLPDHKTTKKCYYLYRGTSGTQIPSSLDGGTTSNSKVDSIVFPSAFQDKIETDKCVDPGFVLSSSNFTGIALTTVGVIEDSSGAVTGATPITLEVGDYIFRAPYKVELFVRKNEADGNRPWLYSRLTNVASACSNNYSSDEDLKNLDQALAPAEKINLVSSTPNSATVSVVFRTDFKGNKKSKYFSVTRTFGG